MLRIVCLISLFSLTACQDTLLPMDKAKPICVKWQQGENRLRANFYNSLAKRGIAVDLEVKGCYKVSITNHNQSYNLYRDNYNTSVQYQYNMLVIDPQSQRRHFTFSVIKQNNNRGGNRYAVDHQAMRYFSTQFIQLIHLD